MIDYKTSDRPSELLERAIALMNNGIAFQIARHLKYHTTIE